ncbi:MAG: helix-hairpin-helix domain-containing protein [Microscillaceae bacterium]|jgi:DNA uptake protein ComE-like DNA-binding protein|nr:helix-hairpin-helix domain-containing protein [Microscillaceae bacterium]
MFKKIRFWLRDSLGFSQTESNGFMVLSALMLVCLFLPFLSDLWSRQPFPPATDQARLDSLVALIEQNQAMEEEEKNEVSPQKFPKKNYTLKPPSELFAFDPNTITVSDWQKLGLSKNLAERIEKYRAKGGKFRYKSDLKKVYGFAEALYQQLQGYIQLPEKPQNLEQNKNNQSKPQPVYFDLNVADTTQLKKVRGIGTTLAQRIVGYRDKLGGFVSLDQLNEVYNLSPDAAEELKKYSHLTAAVKKIYINQASAEELKRHPYLKKIAYNIVNYRQQHGFFTNLADLKKIKTIDDAIFQKIAPYLSL